MLPGCNIDPKTFEPKRFLNDKGQLRSDLEGFIPFGIGKRICLGKKMT